MLKVIEPADAESEDEIIDLALTTLEMSREHYATALCVILVRGDGACLIEPVTVAGCDMEKLLGAVKLLETTILFEAMKERDQNEVE